jgi:hypothetical protein
MTTSRGRRSSWIGGLAALLALPAIGVVSGEAASAELPVPPRQAAQPARPMSRTCIGTDGKAFRWDQPNVPFAAVCSFDTAPPSAPPGQAPK